MTACSKTLVMLVIVGLVLSANTALSDKKNGRSRPVYRSPIHLSIDNDNHKAYVLNQTADTLSIIDIVNRKVIDEIPVGLRPTHAVLSPDGQKLYVTVNYSAAIRVVDLREKRVVRSIETGDEPYGLFLSRNGRKIYVANSLSNTVSLISTESGNILKEIPVGMNPRFIVEAGRGGELVVGNGLSRDVSIIDLSTGLVRETRKLGRASLLRGIAYHPDGRWVFVAHIISHDEQMTLQMERGWIHSNGFSVLDLKKPGAYVTLLLDRLLKGASNPWGLVISPDGERLYISLSGVHEVAIVDVRKVLDLVSQVKPEEVERLSEDVEIVENQKIARRLDAGGIGPRGLALSESTGELLVANYFSDTVTVMDAQTGEIRAIIPLGPPQEMTPERKGEMLFNDARLCYQQWFSCASCHQEDAFTDGLNWDLPNDGLGNPKNVKSLHDIHDTPPAMWAGVRRDIDAAVAAGQRFLGFLPEPENHRALVSFLSSKERIPNPYRRRNKDAIRRGERIFIKARCQACHPPPQFTDLRKHDLGLASDTDLRSRFDTPSLRECHRTAPYLHDGRAQSLKEIFTEHNANGLHGRTNNLSEKELDDLVEYIRSL